VKLFTGAITVDAPGKPSMQWPAYLSKYNGSSKQGVPTVHLPLRFLKINEEIAIWSAPLELFCEIANEVRDRSPFPFTFYFGYTNGWMGYLPTEKEWVHGGYEVEVVCPYSIETGRLVTETVSAYLQGEMKSMPKR
jgi:hypothetical protein